MAQEKCTTTTTSQYTTSSLFNAAKDQNVVVANIQSDILTCFSSELVKLLNKKSYLILSGILKTENKAIEKHFKSLFSENQNVSYQSRNLNDWNLTIIRLDE